MSQSRTIEGARFRNQFRTTVAVDANEYVLIRIAEHSSTDDVTCLHQPGVRLVQRPCAIGQRLGCRGERSASGDFALTDAIYRIPESLRLAGRGREAAEAEIVAAASSDGAEMSAG